MENREREDNRMSIDRNARIQVTVNQSASDNDFTLDMGRVFHTMKLKWRVFAWVMALCIVVGACAPLLLYQFSRAPLTVSSVVTLKYEVQDPSVNVAALDPQAEVPMVPVEDLTAPDGSDLDLNQITSSYVLQNAMDGLALSGDVGVNDLRANIRVERILTEESRRQQEVAASMVQEKNSNAYTAVQELELKYENTFVVFLTNGFGQQRVELTDAELRRVLDRVLAAYNDYLVTTYSGIKLPDDEISAIDVQHIDILESLDQLRGAVQNLYDYCDAKSETVKNYRSWRTGRSLVDWMETLQTVRDVNVEYLYSYVYTNSIVKDKSTMITNYQYQLREAQTELDVINENIATVKSILEQYKNDEISVSMQESDAVKSTKTTTDYYNELILQQADNYDKARELETTIADLEDKIASLNTNTGSALDYKQSIIEANQELTEAVQAAHGVYEAIVDHMSELMEQPLYVTYAEHSSALGSAAGLVRANAKRVAVGVFAGALLAFAMWFVSGLAPEFRHGKGRREPDDDIEEDSGREAAE